MLSTDRTEFKPILAKLCAGFNVPMSSEREEAYWTGLSRMSLLQFSRAVDHALSEDGPEKIPPAPVMWKILKAARGTGTQITQAPRQADERDHVLYFANRLFLRYAINAGGLSSSGAFAAPYGVQGAKPSEHLAKARAFVARLVGEFEGYIRERDADATPAEFISQMIAGLERIGPISPSTLAGWHRQQKFPAASRPFPEHYGRPLTVKLQGELVPA